MRFFHSVGWKLQDFSDFLQISQDMYQFGSPADWDASPGEHNLIDLAICLA